MVNHYTSKFNNNLKSKKINPIAVVSKSRRLLGCLFWLSFNNEQTPYLRNGLEAFILENMFFSSLVWESFSKKCLFCSNFQTIVDINKKKTQRGSAEKQSLANSFFSTNCYERRSLKDTISNWSAYYIF